jgi:hypothetical protein
MTQDQGPPGAYVVNVAIPVRVPHIGPFAPSDVEGMSAYAMKSADRAVYPTGNDVLCLVEEDL